QRWQMEYGDGRRTLAKEETRYDIIEADAILPQGSHSGLLYSAEFIDQARRRLAPGGLYIQWAPTQRAVETFASVFPHALLLMPAGVMIGSNEPIPYDPARLAAEFTKPAHLAHLRAGNTQFSDWVGLFADAPLRWLPGQQRQEPPLTDVFPRDEFYLNNPGAGTDHYVRSRNSTGQRRAGLE
ncbi:MAG: hypothetical protein EBU14_05495, partial [Acetobacteraceae bacterium]|nr:hypothetical protein [Acetobacteraceae bacterium]